MFLSNFFFFFFKCKNAFKIYFCKISAPIKYKTFALKVVLDAVSTALVTTPIHVLLVGTKTCQFTIAADIATGYCLLSAAFSTLLTSALQVKLEPTY